MPTYDPKYFSFLETIEDRHFWFRARNLLIKTVAQQIAAELGAGLRVLEIGCGNGNVLRWLRDAFPNGTVIGMDLFTEALQFAGPRARCDVVTGDIGLPPFRESMDVIGAFDVLEHLPDDAGALDNIREMLVPQGKLMITVPAHDALWSYFDEASHHHRRYNLDELQRKLISAGFRVEFLTYYMAPMYPIIYIGRKLAGLLDRRLANGGQVEKLAAHDFRIVPVVNTVLAQLMAWDCGRVARRRKMPFGASLIAVAEKS